jgi:predicted phage terminase large subunit-like protein
MAISLLDPISSARARIKLAAASVAQHPNAGTFENWLTQVSPNFTWSWDHLRFIREHLDDITAGTLSRLVITVPPRHGKSELGTIRYPVFRLQQDPSQRVVIAAYSQTLANTFSRKARRIAQDLLTLASDRKAVEQWDTIEGGGLRAVGVGAGITGLGANLILIDDPVKSREEAESEAYRERVWNWYRDDLYTRLEPSGAVVLTMTRWHEDDLAGRILNSDDASSWTVVNLPAIAEDNDPLQRLPGTALCPERYDLDALNDRRRVLGEYGFNALFQQRPSPPAGGLFKRSWWQTYRELPQLERVITSWDLTFKDGPNTDYVVGMVIGQLGASFYLLDVIRDRMDITETLPAIVNTFNRYKPVATIVEDKANGPAVIAMLKRQVPGLIAINPQGGKFSRAAAISPLIEAGNVHLPERSSWASALIEEAAAFPNAAHDDQVDALSQGLTWLRSRPAISTAAAVSYGQGAIW